MLSRNQKLERIQSELEKRNSMCLLCPKRPRCGVLQPDTINYEPKDSDSGKKIFEKILELILGFCEQCPCQTCLSAIACVKHASNFGAYHKCEERRTFWLSFSRNIMNV